MHNRRPVTIVVATLVIGFGVTGILASIYRDVRQDRTEHHLARARTLAAHDRLAAAEEYRAALLLDRDSPEAGRGLAVTLLALNRFSEAESYLRGLLGRDPTDGPLNRALARVQVARGDDAAARVSYQRAIYGEWPEDATAARIETRFELIDHLRRGEARDEVLAELLRLRAEMPPGQTSVARRVGDLLVEQGAADLAIQTLQSAAASAPRDAELLGQLAGLQVRQRQFRDAQRTLREAARLEPRRSEFADRLHVVDRILALDPTLPGLRLSTRTRRARLVLEAVVAQARTCSDAPLDTSAEADAAIRRLRQRARTSAESAEEDLEMAARLWAAHDRCHELTPEARALTHVLQRVLTESDASSQTDKGTGA